MKYLYNGMGIMPLQEWNMEKYPHVCMTRYYDDKTNGQSTIVHISAEPPVYVGQPFGTKVTIKAPRLYYAVDTRPEVWTGEPTTWTELVERLDSDYNVDALNQPVWTNTAILKNDGTVYLAASYPTDAETGEEITDYGLYPVPVSPVKINPALLVQGIIMSRQIPR